MSLPDVPARYGVVLTHNRPDLLARCVAAAAPQLDLLLVIDNASTPPATVDGYNNVLVVHDDGQPPNLARMWNRALDAFQAWRPAHTIRWDVAVLCDDAILPDGWVHAVSTCMREHGAAAASTHQYTPVTEPVVKTAMDSDIHNRMCGWAFMLAGEKRLRADETMHWWYLDTAIDVDARLNGGMVIVPGPVVFNERPNDFTCSVPGLAERAGRDRQAFAAKYGSVPW